MVVIITSIVLSESPRRPGRGPKGVNLTGALYRAAPGRPSAHPETCWRVTL